VRNRRSIDERQQDKDEIVRAHRKAPQGIDDPRFIATAMFDTCKRCGGKGCDDARVDRALRPDIHVHRMVASDVAQYSGARSDHIPF
jgi:hypothetical protein